MFVLQVSYTSAIQIQLAIPYQMGKGTVYTRASAPIFVRSKFIYSDNTNWNRWQPIQAGNAYSRYEPNGSNANDLPWDGWWSCNTNVPIAGQYFYVLQENNAGNRECPKSVYRKSKIENGT